MQSFSVPFVLLRASSFVAVALVGCTTSRGLELPDVYIPPLDAGPLDVGVDAGFPDPTIDPCEEPGHTLGQPCEDGDDCNDGCYCNGSEVCVGGTCQAGADPCVDAVDCTEDACLEETNQCFHMPNHAMCSNGLACDGYELCDRLAGCVPAAPLYCNDENACTVDSCDDATGCVYTPRDLDGDGFLAGSCGGDDCDDDPRYGSRIFPGAEEVCDNRRDDDCDGRRDYNDSDCAPTNDRCETATVLPARSGTYSGSTAGLTGSYSLGCASGSGPDAVFRFTLTEPHDVRVSVSGATGAAIALRDFAACSAGPDLKCSATSPPSVLARSLPAGEYAIIVRTSSGGPFDLTLTIGDPTPVPPIDTCGPSTEAITASGTYRGRFEETNDDYRLSCHASGSWRDAAYRLVLSADSDVVLSASTSGGLFTTTYLSLTSDCSTASSTLACVTASTAEIRRRGMPAGTYFVLIESSDAAAVDWTLNVTITTPPAPRQPGDACSTSVMVPLSPGAGDTESGSAMAMLSGAELDGGTSCGGSTSGNRDVYFHFDITDPAGRDVTLTSSAAGLFHYVALQSMCGVTGSEVRCRSGSGSYMQSFRSLPMGRYYVVISTGASSGNATVTVDTRPATPIPPNDRCDGAIELTSGVLRRDTLIGFEDDVMGSFAGYPDAFYRFTLTSRQMVTLIVTSMPTSVQTYIFLRSSCTSSTSIATANGTGTATLVRTLDPGDYIAFVEMPPASATDFSIRALFDPP